MCCVVDIKTATVITSSPFIVTGFDRCYDCCHHMIILICVILIVDGMLVTIVLL